MRKAWRFVPSAAAACATDGWGTHLSPRGGLAQYNARSHAVPAGVSPQSAFQFEKKLERPGSSGTYSLGGSGLLSAVSEYIGYSGSGAFTQSGGTNTMSGNYGGLYVGYNSGSGGSYGLSGSGLLSAANEYIGYSGTGAFAQSGGTNNAGSELSLGWYSGSSGTYGLSGSGLLSTSTLIVGNSGAGTFAQTGGSNSAGFLSIGSSGYYQFSGGTLQVNAGLANQGVFDGTGNKGSLSAANSIVDLSAGTLQNVQNVKSLSVKIGSNSLLLVPTGFNPATAFGSYSNAGFTHTVGTTLTMSAGTGFSGNGDITDYVNCQGTIAAATGGWIDLDGGVAVSGSGSVNLGQGNFTAIGTPSSITSGSLSANMGSIGGLSGNGTFNQSGGTNNITGAFGELHVGEALGASGTYSLSSPGMLSVAAFEFIGNSGTGTFIQSGGTNNITGPYGELDLGYGTGSSGTYNLSGSGVLSAANENVGGRQRHVQPVRWDEYGGTRAFARWNRNLQSHRGGFGRARNPRRRDFQRRRRNPRGQRRVLDQPGHDVDRQRRQRQHQYERLPGYSLRRIIRSRRPEQVGRRHADADREQQLQRRHDDQRRRTRHQQRQRLGIRHVDHQRRQYRQQQRRPPCALDQERPEMEQQLHLRRQQQPGPRRRRSHSRYVSLRNGEQ